MLDEADVQLLLTTLPTDYLWLALLQVGSDVVCHQQMGPQQTPIK